MSDIAALSLSKLSNDLADLAERASRGVVAVDGGGHRPVSGLHWRPGLIVTAEEAIEREDGFAVMDANGRRTEAALVGRDPTTDIALLRFAADGLDALETDDASALCTGNFVLALGRSRAGIVAGFGIAAIAGGPWQSLHGGAIDRLMRLDLRLTPSLEGGALVDMTGRVLGMTVAGPRRRALAIPGSTIDRVIDQLLSKGHIARGYLGAGLMPVRQGGRGVLLVSLDPNGPAAAAGLLVGDIITAWDGEATVRVRDVMRLLGPESVSRQVNLSLLRGGMDLEKSLTIGERPRR